MNQLLTLVALAAFVPSALCDFSGHQRSQKAGLERRIDRFCSRVPSSTPLEQLCEASCGTGYTQCTNYYTCFNPGLGQVCCPDGHYCDAGEYCAQDSSGSQICCKHGEPCNDVATSLSTVSGGYLTVSPISSTGAATESSYTSESSGDVVTAVSSLPISSAGSTTASASPFEPSVSATATGACTSKLPGSNSTVPANSTRPPVAVQTVNAGDRLYLPSGALGSVLGLLLLL